MELGQAKVNLEVVAELGVEVVVEAGVQLLVWWVVGVGYGSGVVGEKKIC